MQMNIEENMALAMRRGERRGLRWGISSMEREFEQAAGKQLDSDRLLLS